MGLNCNNLFSEPDVVGFDVDEEKVKAPICGSEREGERERERETDRDRERSGFGDDSGNSGMLERPQSVSCDQRRTDACLSSDVVTADHDRTDDRTFRDFSLISGVGSFGI